MTEAAGDAQEQQVQLQDAAPEAENGAPEQAPDPVQDEPMNAQAEEPVGGS